MRYRGWVVAVVMALATTGATVTATSAAADPVVSQSRAVPMLCLDTGAKFPFLLSPTATVTGPASITPGGTLALRGMTTSAWTTPPGAVSSVAVDQGGAITDVPIDQWGPTDADVAVTAPIGTLVTARLTGSGFSVPIPDPPITFIRSCTPVDGGAFARWVVGGFACDAATGTGNYVGGLYNQPHATPYFRVTVAATGCDAPGAPTASLRASFALHNQVACAPVTTIPSSSGIADGTRGHGQILWPDGTISRLSLTASGAASPFHVELTGRIITGPHRGWAFGTSLTLTPPRPCGDSRTTRITTMDATTTRIAI